MKTEKINTKQYVGFIPRALAYSIDSAIVFIGGSIFARLFGINTFSFLQANSLNEISQLTGPSASEISFLTFVFSMMYFIIFWTKFQGMTPGKMVLGIKIVKENGKDLDTLTAVTRFFGYTISQWLIFTFIPYLMINLNDKKQALHDKIAKTVVVKKAEKINTKAGLILAIPSMILMLGYAILAIGFISALITKDLQSINGQSGEDTAQSIIINKLNDDLSEDVFAAVNKKRIDLKLPTLNEDPDLCAYAIKRLDDLKSAENIYDLQSFYNDIANPELTVKYFDNYKNMGTVPFVLSTENPSNPEEIVNSWIQREDSPVSELMYNYGCVESDESMVVLVTGRSR